MAGFMVPEVWCDRCSLAAGTILTVRPVDAWPGVLAADSERWTR
jgi:hypothetical protein